MFSLILTTLLITSSNGRKWLDQNYGLAPPRLHRPHWTSSKHIVSLSQTRPLQKPSWDDFSVPSNEKQSVFKTEPSQWNDKQSDFPLPSWNDKASPPFNDNQPSPPWNDEQNPTWNDERPSPSWNDEPSPSWNDEPSFPWNDNPSPAWDDAPSPPLDDKPRPAWKDESIPPWNDNQQPWDDKSSPIWNDNQPPWNDIPSPAWNDNKPYLPSPPWSDNSEVPFSSRFIKQNLLVWDNVESRLRDLLESAQHNKRQRDQSSRSVGVMYTILRLAAQLASNCSPMQYVRSYRQTVSAQLLKAYKRPQDAIDEVSKLLDLVRRNTNLVRAEVFADRCQHCGCYQPPTDDPFQLTREKKLAVALGHLATTVLSSYPLKKAIRDNAVVSHMLRDQQAQARLYPLTVKTARVLQLLTSRQQCKLQRRVPWLTEQANSNDDSDTSDSEDSHEVVVSH